MMSVPNLQLSKKEKPQKLYIINFFLELETMTKLYHWMTVKYSRHKAADKLFEEVLEISDKFMETYLGRYGRNNKDFYENLVIKKLSDAEFTSYLKKTAKVLENDFPKVLLPSDTDLLNIRDELLGTINQTLYLFTLE